MSYLSELTKARDAALGKLNDVLALDELKPNYSVDGRSVSWADYVRILTEKVDHLNSLVIKAGGPIERSVIGLS